MWSVLLADPQAAKKKPVDTGERNASEGLLSNKVGRGREVNTKSGRATVERRAKRRLGKVKDQAEG